MTKDMTRCPAMATHGDLDMAEGYQWIERIMRTILIYSIFETEKDHSLL